MIRNEVFRDGVCISAQVINLADDTVTTEEYGVTVAVRPLTADERAIYDPPAMPLDATGALATLLAVHEVVPVEEAAAVVGLPAQALVDEALAWGVAGQ